MRLQTNRDRTGPATELAMAAMIAVTLPVASAGPVAPLSVDGCGPLRPVDTSIGWVDYRLRNSDKAVGDMVASFDQYHTNRVTIALRRGVYSRSVMDDIDYTLRHSPNHHVALQQLSQYTLAGGSPHDFPRAECFFVWARGFAPDDPAVLQIHATFVWKRGDRKMAGALFEQALALDPDSAEAHYNLGLFYFADAQYEKALQQAWSAYAKGYPLPGLRRQLEKTGHWRDPVQVEQVPR